LGAPALPCDEILRFADDLREFLPRAKDVGGSTGNFLVVSRVALRLAGSA
jgi:hypothetical protein